MLVVVIVVVMHRLGRPCPASAHIWRPPALPASTPSSRPFCPSKLTRLPFSHGLVLVYLILHVPFP